MASHQSVMIFFRQHSFVRKSSSVTGGALSAQILPAKASTFTSSSSAFYQHCSKRNNNNNTSAMRSCLQVFNAVSDYAGAEDQGTGRVDKSQFHAAMGIPEHGDGENRSTVGRRRSGDFGEGEHGFIEFGTISGSAKVI